MPPRRAERAGLDTENEDGALDTPLHLLPGIGAVLHRRPVAFVAAGETALAETPLPPRGSNTGADVAEEYLRLVLDGAASVTNETPLAPACPVCGLPLPTDDSTHTYTHTHAHRHHHEASLVHQLARQRPDAPPSALDRRRFGFAVLTAQGWDPDAAETSRRGLGPRQTGLAQPLAPQPRQPRAGLGTPSVAQTPPAAEKPTGRTREQRRVEEAAEERRSAWLRAQLLENRDVDAYLGPREPWE